MATLYSTLESSTVNAKQARYLYEGTVTRVASFVNAAAFSVGDSLQLVKIPHGAVITDINVIGSTPDGQTNFGIGIAGSTNLFGSATIAVTSARTIVGALPYTVSVSADAVNRYITLLATCGTVASATASNSLAVVVRYTMDP